MPLVAQGEILSERYQAEAQAVPAPLPVLHWTYLQPEQEAQHSGEEQQLVRAAAATLATPSVRTAINRITFHFRISFLLFRKLELL